jgi:hypothetical protein
MSYSGEHRAVTRRRIFLGVLIIAVVISTILWWNRRQPVRPTQIFEGLTYACEWLESDAEGSGLVHWVRVDLDAPGVELFVTPLDPEAVAQDWQYRLQRTASVVTAENLAVGMNGTLFTSKSGWLPMAGDLSRAVETTVADHRISHVWEHTYLLWFDENLTPQIENAKPPSKSVLAKARWGIGGQGVGLHDGKIREGIDRKPTDSRTAVGIDRDQMLLFLAVFENASPRRVFEKLAELGAREGMLLDGGDSTCMALGKQARGIRPGVLAGGWRPVATHFGVRANVLR